MLVYSLGDLLDDYRRAELNRVEFLSASKGGRRRTKGERLETPNARIPQILLMYMYTRVCVCVWFCICVHADTIVNLRRPGILVLINDADWELEGEEIYELQEGDCVLFVSTLHGG